MENFREQLNHIPQLKNGNIIRANFTSDYIPGCPPIRKGKHYFITGVQESLFSTPTYKHPLTYDIVLCTKTGKLHKENHRYNAWSIDIGIKGGSWTLIR